MISPRLAIRHREIVPRYEVVLQLLITTSVAPEAYFGGSEKDVTCLGEEANVTWQQKMAFLREVDTICCSSWSCKIQ